MRITNDYFNSGSDYVLISQNAEQDPTTLVWTSPDNSRDSYLIEMIDSDQDSGYVSIKRADATAGNITWTEIIRVNFDGTMILHEQSATIAAAAANALKLFAKDYDGRSVLTKRDSIDEVSLMEGKGLTRIWRQGSEPADAKLWDLWVDTSDPSTVWDDLRTPATIGKKGVDNPPTFAQFKDDGDSSVGVFTYSFADEAVAGNEEQLYFAVQLPHTYKEGTDIKAHVHWTPAVSGGANEFVKWGLEYTWADMDGTFSNTTIITSDASSAATATKSGDVTLTAGKHYFTDIGTISGTGKIVSSMLICRLFRNSSHDDDDLAQAAFLFEMDFHFEIDLAGGSREEFAK